MTDETNPNYSGGHWEAMKPDGSPITSDTSLMHGWSTWPVYLLPRYLGGVEPLEPGWRRWRIKPVLAGLEEVDVKLSVPAGMVRVSLRLLEREGTGSITLAVPRGTVAEVFPPEGWVIVAYRKSSGSTGPQIFDGQDEIAIVKIRKSSDITRPAGLESSDKSIETSTIQEIKSQDYDGVLGL
jgi:hypothetical protein